MAINDNTAPSSNSDTPPLFPWPATGELVSWPVLLKSWAEMIGAAQGGHAGLFICELLSQQAAEAADNKICGPAHHATFRANELAEEAAYIASLEHDAQWAWDHGDEPNHQFDPNDPGATGSLIGPDEDSIRAWLPRPDDEMN